MLRWLPIAFLATSANASALPAREPPTKVVERASTCTPVAGNSGSTDDVPALQSAIAACPSGTIYIPASTTYYVNSVFDLTGCSGCTLQLEGTLKIASDTDYWNGKTAQILVEDITGLTITSSTGSGLIDGNGQDAYDRFAEDSSYDRPTMLYISGTSTEIAVTNLQLKNPPNVFVSATSGTSNIDFSDLNLSATSKSDNDAKNTDGFDISGSYVTMSNIDITNDDDCIAFKPGANYVTVTDVTCTGSHGLSVGSLGSEHGATDTVSNIYVNGATMIDSTKAAGIKLYPAGDDHGTAVVKNVTWENVVVDNTDYAFQIQSCYGEDTDYCDDSPSTATLTDIVVKGFSGTTSDKYDPTVANINCPAAGTCDVTLSSMTVKAPSGSATYLCADTPSSLGVTCSSGASG
ncbi:putative Extracellular exo-polygalacturonase [Seiridium cardinale]|uniref:Extracellular exo-polygalacturonase n=1 Tax=Seiridium cardinale TaxID=138064 RepID=A0ABR2X9V7_9PEZI